MQEPQTLTLPTLEAALHCLTVGSSTIKEAESALLSWQKHQVNAYTQALLCATLNPQIRLAALLSLKAVVKQSWKDRGRSRRQFLDEATKQQVRCVLLALVTTGENPLVQQETIEQSYRSQYSIESVIQDGTVQAAATSCLVQVAMLDLPKQSQDLIPLLVSHVMTSQQEQKRNTLRALEAILEELSQKRLLGVKQHMRTVAVNHVATLIQDAARLVTLSTLDPIQSEMCLLLVRVIHYLLQSSLSTILMENSDSNTAVVGAVDQWMKLTLDVSTAILSEATPNQLLFQLCESMWELVVDVQEAHPIAFGRYLEPFLNLYESVVFLGFQNTSAFDNLQSFLAYCEEQILRPCPVPERIMILALRFLANVVGCSHYVPDETTNEAIPVIRSEESGGTRTNITSKGDAELRTTDVQRAVHVVWTSFFSSERVCNLADICACRFMRISPQAIEEWAADPEDYFLSEEHRTIEDNVSLAAQNLYCAFVESPVARPIVLPRLVALLNDSESQMNACRQEISPNPYVSGESSNAVHPSVLLWEAVYSAAGLSASALDDFGAWDFGALYRRTSGPCLDVLLSNNAGVQPTPLLRRRIIWLIGCNSSRLPTDSPAFKSVVEVIATDTTSHNDIAVKLSAVTTVSTMVGNFDQAAEQCVPHAALIVESLYRLANECVDLESQASVLDAIPLILTYITGTGGSVTIEVATACVAPLPSVWDGSNGERVLLRRNVVSILAVVASSLGSADVERLLPIALPIIASSLDPRTCTEHSFLVDETLLLWLTILRLTETYTATIGSLFQNGAVGLLEVDFEHLRLLMMITETYIMLGGQEFLAAHAESLSNVLRLTVANVRSRGAAYVGLVLEALLRGFPADGARLLIESGVATTMLRSCALSYANDKGCESGKVISVYLNAVTRILFASPTALDSLFPVEAGESRFEYSELLQLYLRLLNNETGSFSKSLWMKFLLVLLPFPPMSSETQLSVAFLNVMEAFLLQCVEVLPGLLSVGIPVYEYYQPEYDSEEENIDIGQERYEELLRTSHNKNTLGTMDLRALAVQKLTHLCQSPDGTARALRERMNPQVLEALNGIIR